MEYFFVYGTLKTGHRNNDLLEDSLLLGEATTTDKYVVYDLGFPGAVKNDEGLPLKGELYEVYDLAVVDNLDRLEGNGHFYKRHKRVLRVDGVPGGKHHVAWIYELPDTRWGMAGYCPIDKEENAYVWK